MSIKNNLNYLSKLLLKNYFIILIFFIGFGYQGYSDYQILNSTHMPYKYGLSLYPNEDDILLETRLLTNTLWETYMNIISTLKVVKGEKALTFSEGRYTIDIDGQEMKYINSNIYGDFESRYYALGKQEQMFTLSALTNIKRDEFKDISVSFDSISRKTNISGTRIQLSLIGSDIDMIKLNLETFAEKLNADFSENILDKINTFFSWSSDDLIHRIEIIQIGSAFTEDSREKLTKSMIYYDNLLKTSLTAMKNSLKEADRYKSVKFSRKVRTYELERSLFSMIGSYLFFIIFSSILVIFLKENFYYLIFRKKK